MNSTNSCAHELIQAAIELPFLLFHVSVTACVARQIDLRKEPFKTIFFKLYTVQSCTDIGVYLMVSCWHICQNILLAKFQYLFFIRLIDLFPPSLRLNPWLGIWMGVTQYLECLSYALHIAIATNRYCVIANGMAGFKVLASFICARNAE